MLPSRCGCFFPYKSCSWSLKKCGEGPGADLALRRRKRFLAIGWNLTTFPWFSGWHPGHCINWANPYSCSRCVLFQKCIL